MSRKAFNFFFLANIASCFFFVMMGVLSLLLLGFLLQNTYVFFQKVSPIDFLFGMIWRPTITSTGDCLFFGSMPILLGTLWVSFISLLVVGPIGILAAIYLGEYTSPCWRQRIKVVLEFCAGIPTIVYGVFTCIMVAPFFQDWGETLGISISGESALVIGSVIGLMNLPFVVSLTDEILFSIPAYVRRAAWALGSTQGETVCRVVLPAAFPGVMAVLLLAVARSLGETMIVLMAASLSTHMTLNPLTPVTTITAQISALLTGDQSPENPKTQAVFALGLLLFTMTLSLNFLGSRVVRKYSKNSKGTNSLFGGGGG